MLLLHGLALVLAIAVANAQGDRTWETIEPGGHTGCGYGADFRFHFRPGPASGLVIEFQGGGACWNELTCALPIWLPTAGGPPSATGLASISNEANPVRDYNYLYIPYCTGDVHVGNREAAGVRFNGANNTRAALEWVYERVAEPASVLTVGCSAGSLGATVFSRWVSEHYSSSRCVSFGDSYVGVLTESWWATLDENWDLFDSFFPAPGLEPERLRAFRPDIVGYIGQMYALSDPTNYYAQFNFNSDVVQIAFTTLAGGNPLTWTADMRAIIPTFLDVGAVQNTAAAIATGASHCTTPANSFCESLRCSLKHVPTSHNDCPRTTTGKQLSFTWRVERALLMR